MIIIFLVEKVLERFRYVKGISTLGLQRPCALKLADKVHSHTITSFQSILQCRRFMKAHPRSIPGD